MVPAQPAVLDLVASASGSSGDDGEILLLLHAGFVVGVYLLYDGFETWRMAQLIKDTPTEKVRSMAVGRTELEGVVQSREEGLSPPYGSNNCVYVSWSAKRREKRRDDDGNVHYTWETVADGAEAVQFDLDDGTGQVRVRADADDPEVDIISDEHSTTVTFRRGQPPGGRVMSYIRRHERRTDDPAEWAERDDEEGFIEKATDVAADLVGDPPLQDTDHRRRYEQKVLPAGSEVYVFGSAEPRAGTEVDNGQQDLLEIRRDGGTGEFLIADTSEKRLQDRYSSWGPRKTIAGLVLSPAALGVLLWRYRDAYGGVAPLLGELAAVTTVIVGFLWWTDSAPRDLLRYVPW